ncbi:MAG TPA: hypothetical protein VK559_00360 [Ferruginibacter sp.]|nr:hypothetical protein [Ferruginibacter sp.]
MQHFYTDWLPLIIVFAAGGLTLQQIRSNNITNSRIKWLENLKQLTSEFFSECTTLIIKEGISGAIDRLRKTIAIPDNAESYYSKITDSLIDHLKIVNLKHDLIKLNLNPKEPLHIKFEKILDSYMGFFNKIPSVKQSENDYKELVQTMDSHYKLLVRLTRHIMKLEWEKTKRSYVSSIYYVRYGEGKKLLEEALSLDL